MAKSGKRRAIFQKWELEMVKTKAKAMVRRDQIREVGKVWTKSDVGDLEQELLLQVLTKRNLYNQAHKSKASLETFLKYALDKHISNMVRERSRQKRGGTMVIDSLDRPLKTDESESTSLGETLSNDRILGARPTKHPDTLPIDVSRTLKTLNTLQQRIGQKVMDGYTVDEIGGQLKLSRSTVYREIRRMKRLFYDRGLRDYLDT